MTINHITRKVRFMGLISIRKKSESSNLPEVRAIRTENALPHIVEATTEQSQQEYDDSNLALSQ